MKEEEARVARLRNEIMADKQSLEDRRNAAVRDIENAEELHAALLRAQQENAAEKEEIRQISRSYKQASEELMQEQKELQAQQEALHEREIALREGFAQMKLAASDLSQRELDIKDAVQFIERKRVAVDKADRESLEQRLVSAASFREWSARQSSELAMVPISAPPPSYTYRGVSARPGNIDSAVDEAFNKYDVFGTMPPPAPSSTLPSGGAGQYFGTKQSNRDRPMSKSAEFDSGFDATGPAFYSSE